MSKIKLFVAVPSTGDIADSQVVFMRDIVNTYADRIEFVYPKGITRRIFHDFARNAMVAEFLESGADILWFLDSDITPPLNTLDLITEHGDKWKMAGVTYPIFMTPPNEECGQIMFTAYDKVEGGYLAPRTQVPNSGLAFVDGLATGCLLIKREVFAELMPEKPYFKFSYDETTRKMTEGEDFYFARRAMDKGIKFFTDFSMVCKHQKSICLLDMNNYAMQYAKKAVLAYHRAAREELARRQAAKSQISSLSQAKSSIILPSWSR